MMLGLFGANKSAPPSNKSYTPGNKYSHNGDQPPSGVFPKTEPTTRKWRPITAGVLSPESVDMPLDVAGNTIPLTLSNPTDQEETFTVKVAVPERLHGHHDGVDSHFLKASILPEEVTIKPGESQVVKVALDNSNQALRAGRYRLTVIATGSHGSRGRSVIVGKAPTAVAVSAVQQMLDAGSIKRGTISVMGQFNIEANTSKIQLQVAVTNLFFNDDASEVVTPSIPLNLASGLQITSTGGNIKAAKIDYQGRNTTIDNFLATNSIPMTVADAQGNGLRDTVCVTAEWTQDQLYKISGTYYGRIRVTALVLPDE